MERRKFTRVGVPGKVTLTCRGQTISGPLRDLCLQGAFLSIEPQGLTTGALAALDITIVAEDATVTIRAHGSVLRLEERGVAVLFDAGRMELGALLLLKYLVCSLAHESIPVGCEYEALVFQEEKRVWGETKAA